jgi:hypothetical protein
MKVEWQEARKGGTSETGKGGGGMEDVLAAEYS